MSTALRDYCLDLLEIHREILADPEAFDCQDHEERVARMDAAWREMADSDRPTTYGLTDVLEVLRNPRMIRPEMVWRDDVLRRLRELLDKLGIDRGLIL